MVLMKKIIFSDEVEKRNEHFSSTFPGIPNYVQICTLLFDNKWVV
jgi:hypothetical protein